MAEIKTILTYEETTELLDWVSACQSAYHINSTPNHPFGDNGSTLAENREGLLEYVNSILSEHVESAVLAAITPTVQLDGWLPISSAPKGAKGYSWMRLAWGPEDDKCTGEGMRFGDKFYVAASFYCLNQEKQYQFREIEVTPTHWMPKAAAPSPTQAIEANTLTKSTDQQNVSINGEKIDT